MANSCLLEIRKASYFSFPRNIFAPELGLTENTRGVKHMRKNIVLYKPESNKAVFRGI